MTSLNTLWADRYGSPKSIIDLQGYLQDVISRTPRLYYYLINQSLMLSLGTQDIRDQISTTESLLYAKILRMRSSEKSSSLDSSLGPLKALLDTRNDAVTRFNANLRLRESLASGDTIPEEYSIDLEPLQDKGDIELINGPYPLLGDYIQVGDRRVRLPIPVTRARSSVPFVSGKVMGSLLIQVLSSDGYWESSIQLGPNVDEVIDNSVQVPEISTQYIVDLINIEAYGKVTAEEEAGIITVTGESGSYCVQVSGSIGRMLGFPSKITSLHSGAFIGSEELASLLGGKSYSEEIYRGGLSIHEGALVSPTVEDRALVSTSMGMYVVQGDALTPYKSLTPAQDLPTSISGYISVERVRIEGMVGPVSSSNGVSAYKGETFSKFEAIDFAVEGDISSNGSKIRTSNEDYLEVAPPMSRGTAVFRCPRYSRSLHLSTIFMPIPYSLSDPNTYEECLNLNAQLLDISRSLEDQLGQLPLYPSVGGSEEKRALSKIRSAHLDLGFDRAWDLLSKGFIREYLELNDLDSSFSGHLQSILDGVSPSVRSL